MTIKELRTEKKLSQTAFAESIGVSASTIGDIERGRTKVSPKVAEAVKNVYGVEVELGETAAAEAAEKAKVKADAAAKPAKEKTEKKAAAPKKKTEKAADGTKKKAAPKKTKAAEAAKKAEEKAEAKAAEKKAEAYKAKVAMAPYITNFIGNVLSAMRIGDEEKGEFVAAEKAEELKKNAEDEAAEVYKEIKDTVDKTMETGKLVLKFAEKGVKTLASQAADFVTSFLFGKK